MCVCVGGGGGDGVMFPFLALSYFLSFFVAVCEGNNCDRATSDKLLKLWFLAINL